MNSEIKNIRELGYCLLKSVVPKEQLAILKKDVIEVIEEFKRNPVYSKIKTTEYRDYAPALHLKKESIVKMLTLDQFYEIGRSVLGDDVDLRFTSTMTKTSERAESFDWHQDSAYDRDPEHEKYVCWIAITDSTRENGCLRIIPESHFQGLVKHIESKLHSPDKEIETVDESKSIDVEMNAGDVLVFSPWLFHASWPNISGQLRIGLIAGFMKPKKKYLDFELNASQIYLRKSQKKWEKVSNEVETSQNHQ